MYECVWNVCVRVRVRRDAAGIADRSPRMPPVLARSLHSKRDLELEDDVWALATTAPRAGASDIAAMLVAATISWKLRTQALSPTVAVFPLNIAELLPYLGLLLEGDGFVEGDGIATSGLP